jgi:hypothetical protein
MSATEQGWWATTGRVRVDLDERVVRVWLTRTAVRPEPVPADSALRWGAESILDREFTAPIRTQPTEQSDRGWLTWVAEQFTAAGRAATVRDGGGMPYLWLPLDAEGR